MRNSTSQTFAVLRAPAAALFLLILGFPGLDTALPCSPPPSYILTTSVTGQGSVSPAWGSYSAGMILSLTATPEQGWVFSNWQGSLQGSANPASVTMNSNKSVTAVFVQEAVLTTSVQGNGSVSPSGGSYTLNQQISLTATPDAGSRFDHWEGALSGSTNPASLTMDGDKSVTAVFQPVIPILELHLDDDPNGSFEIEPLGVPLGPNEWQYDYGTLVRILIEISLPSLSA